MPRDDVYLLDILIAARKARKFVEGIAREEAVWDTVQNDLPGLIKHIEPLVPPEDETDAPPTPPGE